MIKVIRNDEGKRVILNTNTDTVLYESPRNPPNTGSRYTSGEDVHVHVSKNSKQEYYYKYTWSMWQGTECEIIPFESKQEAIEYLSDQVGDYNDFPSDNEVKVLSKFGIDLLEEEA